jgi:hypothetical protein
LNASPPRSELILTLNPGFETDVAIISAKMDSKFVIAGK